MLKTNYTYEDTNIEGAVIEVIATEVKPSTIRFQYAVKDGDSIVKVFTGYCDNDNQTSPEALAYEAIKALSIFSGATEV